MDDTARIFKDVVWPLETETKELVMEHLRATEVDNAALAFGGALFALGRVLGGFIAAGVATGIVSSVETGWEAARAAGDAVLDEDGNRRPDA